MDQLRSRFQLALGLAGLLSLWTWGGAVWAAELDYEKLRQMSLEELMATEVTSVLGVGQEWFRSPAAVYVITHDELRRSGMRNLADALRLAPGVFVGTVNSQSHTVGMRGFNGGLANKTLVLIDGRSVYDPLFSGTFWDVQDVLFEDLDRIEVIRGPGPTLWGANAVNGVINITTRSAKDTQGLFLSGGAGDEERGFLEARYGGRIADNAWFRVWGKWFDRDNLVFAHGVDAHDEWDMGRGGFRFDIEDGDGGKLMIDNSIYSSDRKGERVQVPVVGAFPPAFVFRTGDGRTEGGHLLARFSKDYEDNSGWSVQAYYDRTSRVSSAEFQADRDTVDFEFRHHFHPFDANEVLWGLGYRYTADRTDPGPKLAVRPRDRQLDTFSGFVQDTLTIVPDKVFFMVGTKIEQNDTSGFELQPGARAWWTPNDRQTLWASFTRAVRVPSRFENDGVLPFAFFGTTPVAVVGNNDLDSEKLLAYEVGHRIKVTPRLTVDTTLFYNDYDELISVPDPIFTPTRLQTPFNNRGTGESYGGELAVTWQAADNLRLVGAYSYARVLIHGPVFNGDEFNTPRNMAQARAYLDITRNLELNTGLYYVDTVPAVDTGPYLRLDVGMTWRVNDRFEISAWGQNLADPSHREFTAIEAQRGFFIVGTFRFR